MDISWLNDLLRRISYGKWCLSVSGDTRPYTNTSHAGFWARALLSVVVSEIWPFELSSKWDWEFRLILGLTFVSRDEKTGEEDWNGCANIKLKIFENTYNFGDYVSSFNVQTNLWVFQYIYKRLKFLNNRNISHLSALAFLAIWHGFHSGYYMTFFMEFMLIHFEKAVS